MKTKDMQCPATRTAHGIPNKGTTGRQRAALRKAGWVLKEGRWYAAGFGPCTYKAKDQYAPGWRGSW